ncbi:MAG: 2,3-bisphosphoglycerate-independent phosphoglycerate mutase [Micropepsaceae bacterium]
MSAAVPYANAPELERPRPAVLCVLDGWGHRPGPSDAGQTDNAIALAETPNFDRMMRECPHAILATSGKAVGLPDGQMGNSEVGHTNIGAGRLVTQDLPRINDAVANNSIKDIPEFRALLDAARGSGVVHLLGLISPGGVHSHQTHITALARAISNAGLKVNVHAILDGRDTPPRSGLGFVEDFLATIEGVSGVRIVSVSGRYYAMDRDKRWERIAKAFAAIVDGEGARFPDPINAIQSSYQDGVTDEFVVPCVIDGYGGVNDGDALLFANFRPDRAREISAALLDPDFDGFARKRVVQFSAAAGLTVYSEPLRSHMSALFAPQEITKTIGEIFAERGLAQLRIAETEKYAHVTFFMNGGRESQFENEDRILVPSPKVATYDLMPEMSAAEVTDRLVEAVDSDKYDLIICNYANPDMVGHTGVMAAAIAAVEFIDKCLGRLRLSVEKAGGVLLITADHGNIEQMKDPKTGEPHTAHTVFDVPIVVVGSARSKRAFALENGRLADVAPTLLELAGIAQPPEMTGRSLVRFVAQNKHAKEDASPAL